MEFFNCVYEGGSIYGVWDDDGGYNFMGSGDREGHGWSIYEIGVGVGIVAEGR